MEYFDFIQKHLNETSKIAVHYITRISDIKIKEYGQVVTEADIKIGEYLIKQIEKTYPDYNIIDEEAGAIDKKSDYTWVIDPIDGTSNFTVGTMMYGIMIGLLKGISPIAGGVAIPGLSEIYIAEKDKGARCNDKPIKVTEETNLENILLAYGIDSHPKNPNQVREECIFLSKIIPHIRNLRISNSAYDFARFFKG